MEANELFIFKRSLLSLRTHGCNNLFIPPTGEKPLRSRRGEKGGERGREKKGERGHEQDGRKRENGEWSLNIQQNVSGWVINSSKLKLLLFSFFFFFPVCSSFLA